MLCRCRPVTAHDKGGGVCVSFPGEGAIELVNERAKRKAWVFDQVKILPKNRYAVIELKS